MSHSDQRKTEFHSDLVIRTRWCSQFKEMNTNHFGGLNNLAISMAAISGDVSVLPVALTLEGMVDDPLCRSNYGYV
jgi:hypothetical protein